MPYLFRIFIISTILLCKITYGQETLIDGIDNDGDGLIDCNDPDLASNEVCYTIGIGLNGLDTTWIALAPEAGFTNAVAYYYTGGDQFFEVPCLTDSLAIKAWAAGGGGSEGNDGDERGRGGAGGYSEGKIISQNLLLVVGEGGKEDALSPTYGGGGSICFIRINLYWFLRWRFIRDFSWNSCRF